MNKKILVWLIVINLTVLAISAINEPVANNIKVIPSTPTIADDLRCDYDYSNPLNYSEQSSFYKWFKNGINQNINFGILDKANITIGDKWYCSVIPSDSLTNGTEILSQNVTILTTVSNIIMYMGNQTVWNKSGYFSGEEYISDYESKLMNELNNCVPDASGYCNITLSLSSQTNGTINLSGFEVYYTLPSAPPTDSILLQPNLGTFDTKVLINWTLSTDPNNDFVRYDLDSSNNSGVNWYSIISNYGFENKLNDSSTNETINYGGNENKTFYLKLPKKARVTNSAFDLTGFAQ